MKSSLLLSLILATTSTATRADLLTNLQAEGSYLREVTNDFVTPHLNWAKPSANSPIRVLAITNRLYGAREVVELAQRFPIDYQAVVGATFKDLGAGGIYESLVRGTSPYEKERELMGKMATDYQVYLLGNFDFSGLPEHARYKILKAVSEGAGLAIFYSTEFPYPKVLAEPNEDVLAIFSTIARSSLPQSVAHQNPEHLVKTYTFGKGRIALIPYGSPAIRLGLTPPTSYSLLGWKAEYENSIALAGRVIQWAAGQLTPASLELAESAPTILGGVNGTLALNVTSPEGSTLKLRVRDRWNNQLWQGEAAAGGRTEVALPPLTAGTHYLDARWEKAGKVVDIGVVDFKVGSPVGQVTVKTNKESYETDEPVEVILGVEKALDEDATVSLTIDDLPEKNRWALQQAVLPKGETEVSIKLPSPHIPTVAALLKASIAVDGQSIAEGHSVAYFPRRKREIFPNIIWDNIHSSLPEMMELHLRSAMPDAAALTHPLEKGEAGRLSALFNQRFIPYMTRIGLGAGEQGVTTNSHWLGMSDEAAKAATGGDGSIHNPAVRDFWKQTIARRMEGLPEIGPMVYTLGDENYYNYDSGYSEADNKAYPEFLKKRYENIERLNQAWGTDFVSFEAVGNPSPEAMRNGDLYPQWYAHRRFVEAQYAEVHHFLAQLIREIDPKAIVGAEGSMPGFLEETIQGLDFWGPYSDPVEDELLRSIGNDKLRAIWWGYNGEHLAYPLWGPLLKGVVNGNQWYTGGIEAVSGMMAVDFTTAKYYREQRQPYVDALNAGPAALLISTPLKKADVAILWSHASQSASVMNDRFFNPRDSAIPVLDFCYQEGLNLNLVTSAMVEQGALKQYRVVFLPGASAISDLEAKAMEDFVKGGGLLIADLNPGILNDSCGPRAMSILAPLFGLDTLKGAAPFAMNPVSVSEVIRGQKVEFEAAKAYQSPESPVFKVTNAGRGTAILLNFNLSSARNSASSSFDDFLRSLFAAGGVKSELAISGIERKQSVLRIREAGDFQIIGLLAAPSEIGKKAQVRLPEHRYIYEVDRGEVGRSQIIEAQLDLPFKLYSVFRKQATAPRWSIGASGVQPGESISPDFSALDENGIYRIEVFAPDASLLKRATQVFAGKALILPVRFAHSDVAGTYRVRVTDVRTGLFSEHQLMLQPSSLSTSRL